MEKGFKISLKSGMELEIHMNGTSSELTIDDKPAFKFTIVDSELEIKTQDGAEDEIISTEEIEYKTSSKNEIEPLRTCINCQGRRYCITNGCANTPCGWICD